MVARTDDDREALPYVQYGDMHLARWAFVVAATGMAVEAAMNS